MIFANRTASSCLIRSYNSIAVLNSLSEQTSDVVNNALHHSKVLLHLILIEFTR